LQRGGKLKELDSILRVIVFTAVILGVIGGTYELTYNTVRAEVIAEMPTVEPQSDFIWIDSNRFHKDSIIFCSPIYGDESKVIGSYIRITYGEDQVYIECLDREGYTWQDWKQSWLDAFKEGCK